MADYLDSGDRYNECPACNYCWMCSHCNACPTCEMCFWPDPPMVALQVSVIQEVTHGYEAFGAHLLRTPGPGGGE